MRNIILYYCYYKLGEIDMFLCYIYVCRYRDLWQK